jgi:SAM-dependent methyltransferase
MQASDLKTTFNRAAMLYDKARPHYPEALFETLIEKARLQSDAHLLEIGPGTGQATEPLAQRGYSIVAIELGHELAAIAKRNLSRYPKVEVRTGAFEDVLLPSASFDLVYSATAFHWIKPSVQYTKPHDLLKSGGHLAIIHTHHVSDEAGDPLHALTQPIYDRYFPPQPNRAEFHPPRVEDIKPPTIDTDLFEWVEFAVFPMIVTYTTEEYTNLLGTFSPELSLPQAEREAFLTEIATVINRVLGGTVQKCYAMSLALAKKR